MIAGSAYYELNQLSECRKQWELFMQIQEAKLPKGHLEVRTRLLHSPLRRHFGSLLTESDIAFQLLPQYGKSRVRRYRCGK